MAKAKAGKLQTTRKIILTVTEGEADLILALTGLVGGSPSKSPAKYARRVNRALEVALGYRAIDTDAHNLMLGHVEAFNYDDHPNFPPSLHVLAALESVGLQVHAEVDPDYQDVMTALGFMASAHAQAENAERDEVSA